MKRTAKNSAQIICVAIGGYDAIIKFSGGYPEFLKSFAERKDELQSASLEELAAEIREQIIERMLQRLCVPESWADSVARKKIPRFNPHTYQKLKKLSLIRLDDEKFFRLDLIDEMQT